MPLSKSSGAKLAAIPFATLVLALLWLARPNDETGGDSRPPKASARIERDQVDPGQTDRRKSERAAVSAKAPHSFTVDELVAIHQSEGAAAAIAAAKGMTGEERTSQVVFILTYLARIDPELVANELKDAGLDTVHQGFVVDAVLSRWKDGKKALDWATTHLTGNLLKTAVGGALRILVQTDPDAAMAYLENLPASGNRSQAMSDLFSAWGETDPKAALKLIGGKLPADDLSSAITSVVAGWSRSHPAEAAVWVAAVEDDALRINLVGDVVRNWKSSSPAEATAWVESLPEGPGKEAGKAAIYTIQEVISCGFGEDQGPDLSWKTKMVATMEDKDFRNWGYQDPEGARKFLETQPEGKELVELATIVAAGMSRKEGPEATLNWAQTLEGETAKKASRAAVILWSQSDPAGAAKRVEALEPDQRSSLTSDLTEIWSRNDPAAAAAWVAGYGGAEQKTLVREVLQQWTDSQPREAYAWLGTLPMGPSRDEGIHYLMRREAPSDPHSVRPWIDLLSEPQLREKMRTELEDNYLKAD